MHGRVDVDEFDAPFGALYPSIDGSHGTLCTNPWIRCGDPHGEQAANAAFKWSGAVPGARRMSDYSFS